MPRLCSAYFSATLAVAQETNELSLNFVHCRFGSPQILCSRGFQCESLDIAMPTSCLVYGRYDTLLGGRLYFALCNI